MNSPWVISLEVLCSGISWEVSGVPGAQLWMCSLFLIVYIYRRLGGDSDREIVSFRSCVRAVWLPGGIRAQIRGGAFPFSLLARRVFPFPLCGRACSLFPM